MIRKLISFSIVSIAFFVGLSGTASAHDFQNFGSIAVELHVIPNDLPQAGGKSRLDFTINDAYTAFSYQNCNCTVSVSQNNKEIYTKMVRAIQPKAEQYIAVPYVFPNIGDYTVSLRASPLSGAVFKSFTANYPITVKTAAKSKFKAIAAITAGSIGGGLVLYFVISKTLLSDKPKKQSLSINDNPSTF
ncbi:MAG: hypothetical protein NVSMB46_06530 [Candidatus Saccharimonadales bacterium]